ncbi:hypothetical protein [Xanthobacter versatilis]|uniref:hypothetical protein n=1 Tax=Xanthobacter autotrophicus (strain ATCC BAA-1158 / Py2) TaxID=78245 RepID=UPI003728CA93
MTISFNQQTAELTVRMLREAWGGRLPTWEEFKLASKSGRVAVDKTVALQAINLQGMPRGPAVFYGVVTMWVAFLLVPASLVVWIAFGWSWYWMPGAVAACLFLLSVSRNGHCEVTLMGAGNHQNLYELLVSRGAFFFQPVGRG